MTNELFDPTVNIDIQYEKIIHMINSNTFDFEEYDNKETIKQIRIYFLKNKKYYYDKEITTLLKIKNQKKLLEKYSILYKEAEEKYKIGEENESKKILKDIVKNIFELEHFRADENYYKLLFELACFYYKDMDYIDSSKLFIFIFKNCNNKLIHIDMKMLCDNMGFHFLKCENPDLTYSLFEISCYYKYPLFTELEKDIYILTRMGDTLLLSKKYKDAEAYYLRILEIMNKHVNIYNGTSTIKLQILHNLGSIYLVEEHFESAKKILSSCYNYRKKLLGNDNDNTLKTLFKLASTEAKLKEYEVAIRRLNYIIYIFKKKYTMEHLFVVDSQYVLGEIYIQQNKLDEGEAVFINLKNIYKNKYEYSHFNIFRIMDQLAGIYFKQGKYNMSFSEWNIIIDKIEKCKDEETILFKYDIYYNIGITLYKLCKTKSCENIMSYLYNFSYIMFGAKHKSTIISANFLQKLNLDRYKLYCKNIDNKKNNEIKKFYIKLNIDYFFGLSFYYDNQLEDTIEYYETLLKLHNAPENHKNYDDGTITSDIQSGSIQIVFADPIIDDKYIMNNTYLNNYSANILKINEDDQSTTTESSDDIRFTFKDGINTALAQGIDISENVMYNLSCAYYRIGDYINAEGMIQKLIEKYKIKTYKKAIDTILYLREHLLIIYYRQNKIELVKEYLNNLAFDYKKMHGINHESYKTIIDLSQSI